MSFGHQIKPTILVQQQIDDTTLYYSIGRISPLQEFEIEDMSPASGSKGIDKKAGKEPLKSSSKTSGHVHTSSGTAASGYNPISGTFHTFETSSGPSASPLLVNSRFRNIDDTDDHNGNSPGTGIEYDSASNNGSWSGESEDHKEKSSFPPHQRQESIPGADNDKREKIRQKNERKHQRQKERRAQELHERCTGYLMSRKLEALAQQFVAMGFSQERATMALIMNDGRVEESISWLLEGGEEDKKSEHNLDGGGGNLKIDISEELARISDIETRYKASKQEVERAVVSCEGDLDKAEEIVKVQKEQPPASPSKPEESGDPPTVANSKLNTATNLNPSRIQPKSTSPATTQQKRGEKDFNYTKVPLTVGPSVDLGSKTVQVLKKIPPKSDWAEPQQVAGPVEKRWANTGPSPSASFSLASPVLASPVLTKTEGSYVATGSELKNLQLGSMKEPVIVMQRPQSSNNNTKQAPSTSLGPSPPGPAMGWYPSSAETTKAHGLAPSIAVSRIPNGVSSNPLQNQLHYQLQPQYAPTNGVADSLGTSRRENSFWGRAASPALAAASSLGLFSGSGASGSPSSVDWNTGSSMLQFDYTNIDWSLDRGLLSSRPNGLWTGASYSMESNARAYDSYGYGVGPMPGMRPALPNGNGAVITGMQDGVASSDPSGVGSREWTSPFEEKDLFSFPRQFVSSPSL